MVVANRQHHLEEAETPTEEIIPEIADTSPEQTMLSSTPLASVVGAAPGGVSPSTAWMIDSSDTTHMPITRSVFTSYVSTPSDVTSSS